MVSKMGQVPSLPSQFLHLCQMEHNFEIPFVKWKFICFRRPIPNLRLVGKYTNGNLNNISPAMTKNDVLKKVGNIDKYFSYNRFHW